MNVDTSKYRVLKEDPKFQLIYKGESYSCNYCIDSEDLSHGPDDSLSRLHIESSSWSEEFIEQVIKVLDAFLEEHLRLQICHCNILKLRVTDEHEYNCKQSNSTNS